MTVAASPSGVVEGVFAADYELWMISSLLNISLAGSAKGKGRSFAYIVEAASGKLIGSSAGERLYNAPERVSASASIHPSIAASAAVLAAPPYQSEYVAHHLSELLWHRTGAGSWELRCFDSSGHLLCGDV